MAVGTGLIYLFARIAPKLIVVHLHNMRVPMAYQNCPGTNTPHPGITSDQQLKRFNPFLPRYGPHASKCPHPRYMLKTNGT